MNRRKFLKGCLAVTAASIVPITLIEGYPVLYADGLHDDTEALQTLLDLKPYICEGNLITGQRHATINGGKYFISKTLIIRNEQTVIMNCEFITHKKYIEHNRYKYEQQNDFALLEFIPQETE